MTRSRALLERLRGSLVDWLGESGGRARHAPTVRASAIAVRCLGVTLAVAFATRAATARQGAFEGWDEILDSTYKHDPDRSEVSTFAAQASARVRTLVEDARAAMRGGDFLVASEALQECINLFPTHLLQVSDRPTRFVGAAEYAKYLISTFPPEGRAAYASFAELRAGALWRALENSQDVDRLAEFARAWELTPQGRMALDRIGRLALERGDFEQARMVFGRRLSLEDSTQVDVTHPTFLAGAAALLDRDPRAGTALLERLPEDAIVLGGEKLSRREGVERLLKSARPEQFGWPVLGGNNPRSRLPQFDGESLTFLGSWSTPAFDQNERNPWLSLSTDRRMSNRIARPFQAVAARDSFITNDGLSVRAFSFYSALPKWRFDGPQLTGDSNRYYPFDEYLDRGRGRDEPKLLGSLARAIPIAATIAGDVVIAPMIERQARMREIEFDQTPITPIIPRRGLVALDLETGDLLWRQHREDRPAQDFANKVSIASPPIVVGDRIYAVGSVLEGAINVYAVCLSLRDGHVLWRTPLLIGQQELTMFNKAFKEFTLQSVSEADGSIFFSTNLGLVACVDALTGYPRWMTQYEAIEIESSRHYRSTLERDIEWVMDAPIVSDGIAVVAPLDSEYCYGFDVATGRPRYAIHYDQGHRLEYVAPLGVTQGVLVIGGLNGIGFHDLRSGAMLDRFRFRENNAWAGKGMLADGRILQPLNDALLDLSFAIDATGVRPSERYIDWQCPSPGNLLLYRDFQVVTSAEQITVYYDFERLVRRVRERLAAGEASPGDRIDLGELFALRGRAKEAITELEAVLADPAATASELRRAATRLSDVHGSLAQEAEAAGDLETAILERRAQMKHAADDASFLRAAESMLATFDKAAPERADEVLQQIEERCPNALYAFVEYGARGEVPAGVFALDRRARMALDRKDVAAAVAALQGIIDRFPDADFLGRRAADAAALRIADLIARNGRDVYAAFDREAEQSRKTALERGSISELTDLLRRFPNAQIANRVRLDLASLRLKSRDFVEVFRIIGPALSVAGNDAERWNGLHCVARAATAVGDLALARLILERLTKVGAGNSSVLEPGRDLDAAARADLSALGERSEVATQEVLLRALPTADFRKIEYPESSRTILIPVAFDRDDMVLIYDESRGAERSAVLRRIDLATLEVKWNHPVEAYYVEHNPIAAFAIGDRLIVRQRDRLFGLDRKSGAERFVTVLPDSPVASVSGDGLIFMVFKTSDGSRIVAYETATGNSLWSQSLDFSVSALQVFAGGLLATGKSVARLATIDALTGKIELSLSSLAEGATLSARAFDSFGALLTLGKVGSRTALTGYDLRDGRQLYRTEEIQRQTKLEWMLPSPNGIILPQGTTFGTTRSARGILEVVRLDPRTGGIEPVVPKLDNVRTADYGEGFSSDRLLVIAADTSMRRTRPEQIVLLDLPTGKATRSFDIPEVTSGPIRYFGFVTATHEFFGLIDIQRSATSVDRLLAFSIGADSTVLETVEIPSPPLGMPTQYGITPHYFAVMRGGTLYAFGTRSPQ